MLIERTRFEGEVGGSITEGGESRRYSLGPLSMRFGLRSRLELRLGLGSYRWCDHAGERRTGFGDASIGFKVGLILPRQPTSGDWSRYPFPALSLIVDSSLPSGDEPFGDRGYLPRIALLLGGDVGDRIELRSKVEVRAVHGSDAERHSLTALSAALGVRLGRHPILYLEGIAELASSPAGGDGQQLAAAFAYRFRRDLQLDFRVASGVGGNAPDWRGEVGFSVRW